ncbi:MAG: thiolase family protein [Geminicoccaceae bacterium]|nr:thiolase family protein [Geminicoccaceae bacterium]
MTRSAVIAAFARSPFQPANRGLFTRTRPDDLLAATLAGLVERSGVDSTLVEDLIVGCAFPEAEQGFNIARLAGFLAGLPQSVAAMTLNRFCGSSMQSIHIAAGAVAMNAGDVFLCAGVESMTRVPIPGFNPMPNPGLAAKMPAAYMSMGETAENVARKYGIDRKRQEIFAIESQSRAAAARAAGKFADEIIPLDGVTEDGCIRADTDGAALAGLEPAFLKGGTVTAGTSSPLTDGAAAVLVTSEDYARERGFSPLVRIRSVAVAGCAPEIMGMGPVAASRKALERAGLTMADIDIVEINEAFASQSLACIDELGIDPAKANIDGGAIALGHPLGATGARITGKAASLLMREGKSLALATQCIGGGQGIATVLEAV